MILVGLLAGIGCGLFFGEYCAGLSVVGDAFIGLLRMTVMPYIIVSLIANLGRLTLRQSRRLAVFGGLVLLTLWSAALLTVFVLSHTFPEWKSGSFFSTAIIEETREFDFLSVFIPSNIFASLTENHVPAVVLLCICVGVALSRLETRDVLISRLDDLAKILLLINRFVIRLAPIGVFAMAASTAGTMSLDEFGRLQAYFLTYTAGALFLGFFILPWLVTTCTPFRYRDVITVAEDAMVTAFATGKLILVLPLLIEQTEQLFAKHNSEHSDGTAPAVDVLYPVAYSFPHIGKLLSMLFIPFAAWFLGNPLATYEYPAFLSAGLFSYFGGPLLAIPYLLDLMQLPHDMFQLYLLSGVYGERVGDALARHASRHFCTLNHVCFHGTIQDPALAFYSICCGEYFGGDCGRLWLAHPADQHAAARRRQRANPGEHATRRGTRFQRRHSSCHTQSRTAAPRRDAAPTNSTSWNYPHRIQRRQTAVCVVQRQGRLGRLRREHGTCFSQGSQCDD